MKPTRLLALGFVLALTALAVSATAGAHVNPAAMRKVKAASKHGQAGLERLLHLKAYESGRLARVSCDAQCMAVEAEELEAVWAEAQSKAMQAQADAEYLAGTSETSDDSQDAGLAKGGCHNTVWHGIAYKIPIIHVLIAEEKKVADGWCWKGSTITSISGWNHINYTAGPYCMNVQPNINDWDGSHGWAHGISPFSWGTGINGGCFIQHHGDAAVRIEAGGHWDSYNDFGSL